jgi:hypothetical protein
MQCSISWNILFKVINTKIISVKELPSLVKILSTRNNQLVTKNNTIISYLVGTSETIRASFLISSIIPVDFITDPSSNKNGENLFNEWLSGLIDGDGSLLISNNGNISCEITMSIEDEYALRYIQNKLGGSIKLRSGVKALRYRLHNKEGVLNMISRINGKIRHSSRLKQLNLICSKLNIKMLEPDKLHNKHGWFSGFFDADGTITMSNKGKYLIPQLTISASNKLLTNISYFKEIFGGNIYFDKGGYGSYKWTIQSKKDILLFLEYVKWCPLYSHKRKRVWLIKRYFELKDLRAYKEENNKAWEAWDSFLKDWTNKNDDIVQ